MNAIFEAWHRFCTRHISQAAIDAAQDVIDYCEARDTLSIEREEETLP